MLPFRDRIAIPRLYSSPRGDSGLREGRRQGSAVFFILSRKDVALTRIIRSYGFRRHTFAARNPIFKSGEGRRSVLTPLIPRARLQPRQLDDGVAVLNREASEGGLQPGVMWTGL
jgi:hypothetical protein